MLYTLQVMCMVYCLQIIEVYIPHTPYHDAGGHGRKKFVENNISLEMSTNFDEWRTKPNDMSIL